MYIKLKKKDACTMNKNFFFNIVGWNTRGEVGIIIADSSNEESVREMCRQSRIVINCVGPVSFFRCLF